MPCRAVLLVLACLASLSACGPSSPPPPPVELGTYELDREASRNASLPGWLATMQARFDQEIADMLPQTPRAFILEKQRALQETRERTPDIIANALKLVTFSAELDTRRRYRLDYKVPAIKGESSCSGRWQWVDEELQFLREQVNDEPADPVTMLRATWVNGSIQLRWPGLDLVFVLRQAPG